MFLAHCEPLLCTDAKWKRSFASPLHTGKCLKFQIFLKNGIQKTKKKCTTNVLALAVLLAMLSFDPNRMWIWSWICVHMESCFKLVVKKCLFSDYYKCSRGCLFRFCIMCNWILRVIGVKLCSICQNSSTEHIVFGPLKAWRHFVKCSLTLIFLFLSVYNIIMKKQ